MARLRPDRVARAVHNPPSDLVGGRLSWAVRGSTVTDSQRTGSDMTTNLHVHQGAMDTPPPSAMLDRTKRALSGHASRVAVAARFGAVVGLTVASWAWSPPASSSERAGDIPPDRFEHTVTNVAAQGGFTCGDLNLTIVSGREIEIRDGTLRDGVAHAFINRVWRRVKLTGSDGGTYRATGVTSSWFVLKAPDFAHPVRGEENITIVFRSAADKSPGYLQEHISIRHSRERDVVTGPCDFDE